MEHNLLCFKRTSTLTALSLPREYREGFYTKSGVWTKIIIIKGKMKIFFLDEQLQSIKELNYNKKTDTGFIDPNSIFRISPTSTDLQFHIEFYCEAQDYFFNKYDLGTAHPEVVNAMDYLSPCKVLDLGAGQGRNSLYLASLGCQISAVDTNAKFLQDLVDISVKEKLNLNIFKHEINEANIKDTYDFIVATDVFMYLNPTRISSVIHNMQKQTSIGGYNLIVSALNTIGVPTIPFPFTFIENELLEYYDGWEIIKYEEYKEITKSSPYPYVVLFAKKIET